MEEIIMDKEDLKYIEAGILGCSESELTEDLSQEVDSEGNPLTQEQINFFRNSKIRDRQGKLVVCYHGTDAKFSVFARGDIGFHFGTEKQAKEILHNRGTKGTIGKYYLNITKYLYYNDDPGSWRGECFYDNFLYLYEDGLIGEEELPQEDIDKLLNCDNIDSFGDLFKNTLIDNGYDGVMYPNKFEAHDENGDLDLENVEDSFIAFYPNQIKSIDNKNPSNSNDINEVLQEGKSEVTSKQNYQNQKAKRNIIKIAKDNQFDFALDTKELSVHHLDDTKDDNGLKNNSYSNLVFIRSKDFRDREVVHKLLHYMDRNNIDYDDLLKELENVKLYSYDEQNNKFIVKSLSSIREQLQEDLSQEVDSDLTEGFWATKKSKLTGLDGKQYEKEYEEYKPEADSKYKRLCRKPINTLTEDEVIYIYAVRSIYMAQRIPYQTPEEAIEDILRRKPYMKNDLEECYEFVHQLSFPLTIYRGVRVGNFKYSELNTDTNNLIISGKQQSYSWTTDINIYKNPTSKFRNLTQIVACEIDSNIIDVANTIFNFIHYSAGGEYRVSYPENEITLKDNFKQSDLHNLRFINKDDINEVLEQLQEDLSQEVDSEGNPLTPEQVEFFKNSKIRDSKGRLLVVYHGTDAEFDTFKKGDIGFHFGTEEQATFRLKKRNKKGNILTCYLNITNPMRVEDLQSFCPSDILLRLCNPKYLTLNGLTISEEEQERLALKYDIASKYTIGKKGSQFEKDKPEDLQEIIDSITCEWGTYTCMDSMEMTKDVQNIFRKNGYDGLVYDNEWEWGDGDYPAPSGVDSYVAFYPNQIKSITNKKPSNSDNINEVLEEDLYGQDKAQHDYGQAYSNLIDNDKTRLYRYREWANNSNNDYKEYIYNDLLNGKKEDALHYWYNHYKLFTGNYDLSYDDFLNTPITLYRATNVNEKEDATNPFFSYAQSKKLAQRFLDTTQGLYNNRTGEIEEIQIKPKDTLGMIPSDEDEIIVPNKAYQNRVNDMSSIVDNVIKYANENNVKLPYDRDYILTLFNKRDKENVKKLETHLINYIDKRRNGNSANINEDLEQLHNYIEDNFGTNNLPKASSYILENGKYVDILGKGLEYHGDLDDELVSTFPEDEDIMNYVDEDGFIPMNLVKKLFPNIIKMNNGSRDVDSMFIELSDNVPTEEQLDSLIRWALKLPNDNIVIYNHKNNIQAYVPTNKITKDYIKSLYGVKEDSTVRIESLTEGKQDIENFKKWIENNEDSNARLMSAGNKEAFINNWATEFNNIRQNLKSPYNDFYYWIKLNDWDAFTKFMQEQRNKKDAKQKEKEGARLIYSDKDWKVYEITTYEASVKYGANTKWCISGSKRWSNGENGRGYWNDYTSKGVKFYFFIGKDTKYAIALYPNGTDFEIFDAQDNAIAYIPNAPIIDDIKVDYYSHNEDRLLLNLVYTGQLPHVCALLSYYLYEYVSSITIYDKCDFDTFLQEIEENVNADYVKWLAVYHGLKDEEWYKEETGEEYTDEWLGDTTWYLNSDLGFLHNYATLEDALTKDNPYFDYDNCEYFISDLEYGDIYCCKDWVSVWLSISGYIGDKTDLINFVKEDIRDTWGYEDFEKVGLSKEYLQDIDESLDESLEDFDDEVGVVYHGGIEKSLHKDFRSILWFTEDYDYALDFGENIFICNLNLKNTFIVGNTDGYIRGLIPTQFSTDFTRLANNLKVTPKELLKCNPDAKNIYSIVRTKAFKELCIKNGYDSVETEEFGHVCFGVFNLDQVDIVDTDFEDESTLETLSPMDESLTPNIREELLLEKGTDYKKQAIKIISNSGLFDEETSTKIIDGLFRQDIHAFNHAPAWLEKYLKGIARMLVEYCDGDKSKVQQFLTECPSEFEYYLTWVKQNREKIGNSLDDEFVNNLTYEQVKEKNNKIRDEIDAKSKDELSKMKFSDSSNYTLVPIDSYKQMHKLYGGHWTGDGTDKEGEYAGNGGTSWCHTNSKYTYGSWVNNGKNKFFVLQRNDWKDIPFNEKTNKEMSGKDDYGNSLIAILVNRFGELSDATLRCNHVGISGSADNQYNSYSELSKVVGFNVEEEILKHGFEEVSVGGLFEVNGGVLTKSGDDIEAYHSIAKYTIPDGTRTIGDYAFSCCSSLRNITIPNSVTSIGAYAFSSCSSLRNIEIPNSVTSIGISAFFNCSSLTSITIPNSVTSIEDGTFSCCRSLTSIEMPNSVTSIEENAFSGCSSLTSITIPNSVISIGYSAFYKCISLTSITIPDSVTSIGSYAFYGCSSLTSVTIPDSVTSIEENAFTECGPNLAVFTDNEYVKKYCDFKGIKYAPLSEYHKA